MKKIFPMKHKHSELIKKWAENTDIKLEASHNGIDWVPLPDGEIPEWSNELEYRELDPYRKFKEAFKNGEKIEVFSGTLGKWVDLNYHPYNPIFDDEYQLLFNKPVYSYRIKYKNGYTPFKINGSNGWLLGEKVKEKYRNRYHIITSVKEIGVVIHNEFYSYDYLFHNYEFIDGSPIGEKIKDTEYGK